ncbi:putative transcription factor C2H2 family [Helianthus anomalus]
MVSLVRIRFSDRLVDSSTIRALTAAVRIFRRYHFNKSQTPKIPDPFASVQRTGRNIVAVFWDLDNKPPRSVSPFDAAIRLKKAAESFGAVRYKIAYANQHSFDYVPPEIKEHRRDRIKLNQLENKGVVKPVEPYICRVCGRKFYTNEKLINHFKQIHEREHQKRVSQIESAKGSQRVKLVGKYSMKMEKYNNAARDILTPKVGYGLGDELKRAGYCVSVVSNKPQAADVALRNHMVDMMDRRQMECLILVSDDSDFVEVIKEARLRCLKTVVVGDSNDGALKRVSDAAFSWEEIIMGKAKKEAVSVVGRWKDRDILKRLEWIYNYERERKLYGSCSEDDDQNDDLNAASNLVSDEVKTDQSRAWWKLESDSDSAASS